MIYLLAYMVVALVIMLWLPIMRARTAHRLGHLNQKRAEQRLKMMTEQERKVLLYGISGMDRPLKTWVLVVAGLLWPTQAIAYVAASIWGVFFGRRVRRAEAPVVCPCPGCGQNLVCGHDVGVVMVPHTKIMRFGCGKCGWLSEWDFEPPVPVIRRTVTPDKYAS